MSEKQIATENCELIQQLAQISIKSSDQLLAETFGFGLSSLRILQLLQQNGMHQKEIASKLDQTEASVSRQVKILQEKGLVVVSINSENRRQHSVFLTAYAKKIMIDANRVIDNNYESLFEGVSEEKKLELRELLKIVRQSSLQL